MSGTVGKPMSVTEAIQELRADILVTREDGKTVPGTRIDDRTWNGVVVPFFVDQLEDLMDESGGKEVAVPVSKLVVGLRKPVKTKEIRMRKPGQEEDTVMTITEALQRG